MPIISILSQKGGAGKTTTAVHLAVAAQQLGYSVLLIDQDPQASAIDWSEAREREPKINVIPSSATDMERNLQKHQCDINIIDTQGRAMFDALHIAELSDICILPCRPSPLDLRAMKNTVAIIDKSNAKAFFLLSGCKSGTNIIKIAEQSLHKKYPHIPVCPIKIHNRQIYAEAIIDGASVTELEPNGKAAEEIKGLFDYIRSEL